MFSFACPGAYAELYWCIGERRASASEVRGFVGPRKSSREQKRGLVVAELEKLSATSCLYSRYSRNWSYFS